MSDITDDEIRAHLREFEERSGGHLLGLCIACASGAVAGAFGMFVWLLMLPIGR